MMRIVQTLFRRWLPRASNQESRISALQPKNQPRCEECEQFPCTGPTLCYGDGINWGIINQARRVARGLSAIPELISFPVPSLIMVICRADRKPDGSKGDYELATRQIFSVPSVAERYASGICPSREPLIVRGDFDQIRIPQRDSQR